MILTLIGMSGSGKTHWSQKLESGCGFRRICCDDLIEEKLRPELGEKYRGIHGVAGWMGWPTEGYYQERAAKYLQCEKEVMREIIQGLENDDHDHDKVVIDTTGSVVYTGEEICSALQELTTIVYLETLPDAQEALMRSYFENPKPVIWGDVFRMRNGEMFQSALERCFPELLEYRRKLYAKYANIRIAVSMLKNDYLDGLGFLALIQKELQRSRQKMTL